MTPPPPPHAAHTAALAAEASLLADFAADVRRGLTAPMKSLPPRWFYDDLGSVLFEAITHLPEYYPTRCERGILERHADAIVGSVKGSPALVELGSGSGAKTTLLLRALLQRQEEVVYCPIDISEGALRSAAANLARDLPAVKVKPVVARYRPGLAALRGDPRPKLILFLGSSLGNFDPPDAAALLRDVAAVLGPDDRLLLGTDLAKDPAVIHAAYDDPVGVTAAFNRNLLARINRTFGGDFDVASFAHRATYRPQEHRVEIDLVSATAQRVTLRELDLRVSFAAGEAMRTEHSYKYTPELLENILASAGLHARRRWTDDAEWFALHLLAPDP